MIVTLRKVLTHRGTHFGGNENPVAISGRLQPPANDLFRNTSGIVWCPDRITICSVDQIPASIHIRTEDRLRSGLIGAPAKLHGSQSDGRDQKSRISER